MLAKFVHRLLVYNQQVQSPDYRHIFGIIRNTAIFLNGT